MGLGEFIAILQLLGYIVPPTVMLPFMLNNLNRTGASLKRMNTILDLPATAYKSLQWKSDPIHADCSVSVENLSFEYNSGTSVISSISFTVNGPGVTAIVGGSGSGKTTLLSLLSGLYRPDSGSIRINGQDTSQMSESELGEWFSVLPQDIYLFNNSIIDNIRVGKEDAGDNERKSVV